METKVPSDVVESTPAKTTEQEIAQNSRKSSTINPNIPPSDTLIDENEIYEYYQRLIPALVSSLPLLLHKMKEDSGSFVYNSIMKMVHLLIPFTRKDFEWHAPHVPHVASEAYGNVTQFLLSHFDLDEDGEFLESSAYFCINRLALKISYCSVLQVTLVHRNYYMSTLNTSQINLTFKSLQNTLVPSSQDSLPGLSWIGTSLLSYGDPVVVF